MRTQRCCECARSEGQRPGGQTRRCDGLTNRCEGAYVRSRPPRSAFPCPSLTAMARRHALWRFFSCCATPRTADVELAPVRRTSSAPVTSVTTRGLATAADSTAPQAPVAVAHALGKAGADSQTTSSQTTPRHKPLHRTSAHGKHKNDSKVVQAWKHGVLGFTFSGGGFLLPFYAGEFVADASSLAGPCLSQRTGTLLTQRLVVFPRRRGASAPIHGPHRARQDTPGRQ